MKKLHFYLAIAGSLTVSFITCSSQQEKVESEEPRKRNVTMDIPLRTDSMPLEIALYHINHLGKWWGNYPDSVKGACKNNSLEDHSETFAYEISMNDVFGALELKPEYLKLKDSLTVYKSIRAYTGLVENMLHLYFVPVNSEGKDVIPGSTEKPFVYDLTAPCPNTCDKSSTLYEAYMDGMANPCN